MENYTLLGDYKALLGESPVWDADRKLFRYLDIDLKKEISVDLKSGETTVSDIPDKAGSMALTENGSVVYAMVDGIYSEDFSLIVKRESTSGVRFNDGKPAPDGRYFVGTIEKGGAGKLYCLQKGELKTVLEGVRISNGLDWSPDLKVMYYCDTATRKIVAFDYPEMGNCRKVIDFSEIDGFIGNPDGLCIDSEGFLWVAVWGGGCVVRVNPEKGYVVEKIDLPATKISCPAFVGENLDVLAVTSSSENAENEPLSGRCFALNVGVSGRAPFKISNQNLGLKIGFI